jgi:two-component system phosphate regulon response regulator PhoB
VLVVDDEPAMRNLAVFVLDRMGYGALTASDGDEAFELARKHLPDLILSDALMPRTDGRELCRRVKMQPETRNVKFVLMTSVYKRRRYEGEAYVQFGVDGFLLKPVSLVELKAELQRQLGNAIVPVLESQSESGTARVAAEVNS